MISLLLALILAACQPVSQPAGEGMTPTTAAVATAGVDGDASPAPEILPETGALDELKPVIAAVLSGDLEARRAVIRFTTTACTNAEGLGGPPKCLPGEEEGATVTRCVLLPLPIDPSFSQNASFGRH